MQKKINPFNKPVKEENAKKGLRGLNKQYAKGHGYRGKEVKANKGKVK